MEDFLFSNGSYEVKASSLSLPSGVENSKNTPSACGGVEMRPCGASKDLEPALGGRKVYRTCKVKGEGFPSATLGAETCPRVNTSLFEKPYETVPIWGIGFGAAPRSQSSSAAADSLSHSLCLKVNCKTGLFCYHASCLQNRIVAW